MRRQVDYFVDCLHLTIVILILISSSRMQYFNSMFVCASNPILYIALQLRIEVFCIRVFRFLNQCRQLSVSMGNAIKYLKHQITQIQAEVSEKEVSILHILNQLFIGGRHIKITLYLLIVCKLTLTGL